MFAVIGYYPFCNWGSDILCVCANWWIVQQFRRSTPLSIFTFGFSGVNVTDRPIILDATDQGVATRMVPWFMLGYLTVFQVTCNGTVFRALNRLLGILFGSLSGWLAMEICGGSLAALITYCSATIFLDTCFLCNSHHPLEGFHLRWGYAGQVFTYTQVLIVCLAYEDQGGMTGPFYTRSSYDFAVESLWAEMHVLPFLVTSPLHGFRDRPV